MPESREMTREELVARIAELEAERDSAFSEYVSRRGVESPCEACSGFGVRAYGSTATWHGGVGGQMITSDVCDKCWGSGDAVRPWPSWRYVSGLRSEVERLRAESAALIARARLAERMAEALRNMVDATEHTYCSPTPEGHIAGESIRRVRDNARTALREWDALENGDET